MAYSVGDILDGKVTGITKFGAFVSIGEGKSGLVHISEISSGFVREVSDHLSLGQEVRVKIIGIDDAGRINLSIKKAQPDQGTGAPRAPRPPREDAPARGPAQYAPRTAPRPAPKAPTAEEMASVEPGGVTYEASGDAAFEDKLKLFMQDSNSRMADIRHQGERKGGRGRRR